MIVNSLLKLISVKSIITIVLTVVFAILTVRGVVSGNDFMTVFVMIITYYFTRRTENNEKEIPVDKEIS